MRNYEIYWLGEKGKVICGAAAGFKHCNFHASAGWVGSVVPVGPTLLGSNVIAQSHFEHEFNSETRTDIGWWILSQLRGSGNTCEVSSGVIKEKYFWNLEFLILDYLP